MGDNGTKECFAHVLTNDAIYPGRKGGNTDNGIHVPLVLNQPGRIPSGHGTVRRYDGLVDVPDIFPTMAEACNVTIPNAKDLDGISFWPQVLGEPGEPREVIS